MRVRKGEIERTPGDGIWSTGGGLVFGRKEVRKRPAMGGEFRSDTKSKEVTLCRAKPRIFIINQSTNEEFTTWEQRASCSRRYLF